ncbi:MAG: tRNA-(ms[2]io[6]A)-hydroxylase, partial [Gammaproteobacteria bacterium]
MAGPRSAGVSARAPPAAAPPAPILRAPTPPRWVEDALSHLPELLLDHANCEK